MRQHNASIVVTAMPIALALSLGVEYQAHDLDSLSRALSIDSVRLSPDNPLVIDFVEAVTSGDPRLHFYLRARTEMRYLCEEAVKKPGFRRHVFVTSRDRTVSIIMPCNFRPYVLAMYDYVDSHEADESVIRSQYVLTGQVLGQFVPLACRRWRALPTVSAKWAKITDVIPASYLDECLAAFIRNTAEPYATSTLHDRGVETTTVRTVVVPMIYTDGMQYLQRVSGPKPIRVVNRPMAESPAFRYRPAKRNRERAGADRDR